MEIKIPKEVRDYHETIFFGLNTRQFICSLLALGVAVGVYFLLRPLLGAEEIGWVCILAAAPFAACVVQIRDSEPQAAGLSFQQLLLRCDPGRDAYEETQTEEAQP